VLGEREREGARLRVRDSQQEKYMHTNSGYGTYLCSSLDIASVLFLLHWLVFVRRLDLFLGKVLGEREGARLTRVRDSKRETNSD
jgi:hypothetical protein